MKLLKNLTIIMLIAVLAVTTLAGCGKTVVQQQIKIVPTTDGMTQDQLAIVDVIMAYEKAYYNCDTKTMQACSTDEYYSMLTLPEQQWRGAFDIYVDYGDMVAEDLENYLDIERKYYKMGSEMLEYRGWGISVSGDTATALVTHGYPDLDSNVPFAVYSSKEYRDELFLAVCGMDEETAKETLSKEEFSTVHLQMIDLDYGKRYENVSYVEVVTELRLKKIDGKWYLSELVLPEE